MEGHSFNPRRGAIGLRPQIGAGIMTIISLMVNPDRRARRGVDELIP
jgi:hypothetical protein